jgi:DNA-binding NarL/FixJ family response regulator
MKKSVMVVDDDKLWREQIVKIIRGASDITCIGAFPSAEDALPEILARKPDVVLMDIKLPRMSGIDCVAEIKKAIPSTQIIMVTVYDDSESIFRALKAGAKGYLLKSSPPGQLLEAIRDIHTGGSPMSSHITRKVVDYFQFLNPPSTQTENLTPREREVLDLLATGLLYKEIANQLNIGITTVRTHIINVCEKLHVRNRVEAVAKLQSKS